MTDIAVSACRGVHPSPDYPKGDPVGPGCYTSILKRWMQDTFTQASVTMINGAIGGTDSGYYSFCGVSNGDAGGGRQGGVLDTVADCRRTTFRRTSTLWLSSLMSTTKRECSAQEASASNETDPQSTHLPTFLRPAPARSSGDEVPTGCRHSRRLGTAGRD